MQKLTAQDMYEWSKIAHSIRNTTSLASEFSLHRHPLLMQERDQHLARGSSQTRANLYTHKSSSHCVLPFRFVLNVHGP